MPYSSEAQQPNRLQLDRLWSGVLGCADRHDSFAIRNRFDSPDSLEDIGDNAGSAVASSDYSECGKLALRRASSRMLVEAIEDSLRQGGLAFSEDFRLDSSIGWVWEENVTGEVDAVIPLNLEPLLGAYGGGIEHALFFQPGLIFWPGLEDDDRVDGNIGLVYRQRVSPDVIAGGSLFYDYDFERGHERLGFGVDVQSRFLQAGLNYYHPLTDWREGRTDYEQHALRGMDVRVGLASGRVQLDTGLGLWRFEGEDEEKTKWRPSFDIEAGYRIYPGVFLQSGYERHDSGDSLGSRWNVGLAFRFSLHGLDGAVVLADPATEPNLYEPVEREKRILYEERLGIPRVNLGVMNAPVAEPTAAGESETAVVMAELGKALDEDVTLNIVVADSSTADLGASGDFTYGYKVYMLDTDTGEQSAPAEATACNSETCPVTIPTGVTRFDIEASILMDSNTREIPEFIDFRIEVPDDYAGLVRGSGEARVTIGAQGNTVAFATDAPLTVEELDESGMGGDTVQVAVEVNMPSPTTPITLNIATAGEAELNTDYRISTTSLTIPARQSTGTITVTSIDDDDGEGRESIVLTISASGALPEGWTLGDAEHTLEILDDDLAVGFARASDTVDEPSSDTDHTIDIEITSAPTANITLEIQAVSGSTASTSDDVSFSPSTVTFTAGDSTNLTKTITINVKSDTTKELSEYLDLRLGNSDGSLTSGGNAFSFGQQDYRLNINASDNTVSIDSDMSHSTLDENGGTANVVVSVDKPSPTAITLSVSAASTSTAVGGTDYTVPSTLRIEPNSDTGTLTLTGVNDEAEEQDPLTIDLEFTGTLPKGWSFDASNPLTHQVTITDDERPTVGWTSNTPEEHTVGSTANTYTAMIAMSKSPSVDINMGVAFRNASEDAIQDVDFFAGDDDACNVIDFPKNATGADLTISCTLRILPSAVGKEIEMTLTESRNTLATDGFRISPAVQTIRINSQ